jgi:putative hydrolase of the HAD superfamily
MNPAATPLPIDLIIFDMDDVLASLDRAKRLDILASVTGKSAAFLHERIWASDFEPAAECGAFATGAEYLAEFNRRTDCEVTREQWVRARSEASSLDRQVLAIAEQLSRTHRICLLTNNGSLLREALPEILPDVARVFGARAHASFEFNARKPQREVFERLLTRYGVKPQRAVFIDDMPEYIQGASALGIHGIPFKGAVALRSSLTAIGLDCKL